MHRTPVDTLAALGKGVGNKKKNLPSGSAFNPLKLGPPDNPLGTVAAGKPSAQTSQSRIS